MMPAEVNEIDDDMIACTIVIDASCIYLEWSGYGVLRLNGGAGGANALPQSVFYRYRSLSAMQNSSRFDVVRRVAHGR